ncbi:DUF1707 domain-containing protein, partial [Candidatus Frankia alpina]
LAEGRLTFAEYDERVGAAYAARTRADFTPLTIDLPNQPNLFAAVVEPAQPTRPAQPTQPADLAASGSATASAVGPDRALDPTRRGPAEVDWTVAVMSGNERGGRWRPSRHTRAVAVMGGIELDLREVAFPTEALMITAVAVMGGIEIIVPEGVEVEVTGVSVMGGRTVKVADTPRRSGAPVVRIRAVAVMGGVEVRSKPPRAATGSVHKSLDPGRGDGLGRDRPGTSG